MMRQPLFALMLCLSLSACMQTEPADPVVDQSTFLRLGDRAYAQGDLTMAANMYQKALAEDPDLLKARQGYAQSMAALGNLDPAIAEYQTLLQKNPKDTASLLALGGLYLKQQKGKEAAEYLQQALNQEISSRAFALLGVAYELQDMGAAAQTTYHAGLLWDEDWNLRSNLGLSLALDGKLRQAMQYLQVSASHPEAKPQHRQNLAFAYVLGGKNRLAEEILRLDLNDEQARAILAHYREVAAQPSRLLRVQALMAR
jgi:Flp pilus assembly protein TadD